MIKNIPQELRRYVQWVVWKYEDRQFGKLTKVPYDPKTGLPASVENPAQWATFEQACLALERGGYNGLGFVLTERDPFTFADLDFSADPETVNRQIEIYKAFNSYSERSPSGQGCHIIIKGHVPKGRRRSDIEVYSSLRYMTMTGDVINDVPIVERQDLLMTLWHEMGRDGTKTKVQYTIARNSIRTMLSYVAA
jgi:primase-polymerase (primpol)-like protein